MDRHPGRSASSFPIDGVIPNARVFSSERRDLAGGASNAEATRNTKLETGPKLPSMPTIYNEREVSDLRCRKGIPWHRGEGLTFFSAPLRAFAFIAVKGFSAEAVKKLIPRVLAETLSPPAFRKGRIGKETPAGACSAVADFPRNLHSAVRIQRVSSCAERLIMGSLNAER